MARPIKNGLFYFPFDVDFFQDKKIKTLKGRYGSDGILVYIYLLCEIYRNGYYIKFDEDLILCISDDVNISEPSARQIISFLLSRSLLHEIKCSTLTKSDTVITAVSIQRRYQEAMRGVGSKRDVYVKAEYWLLEPEVTLSFIKVRSENTKSEKNNIKSEKNSNISEKNSAKKRKQNKTKENNMSEDCGQLLTPEQYNELAALSSVGSVCTYMKKLTDWQNKNGRKCRDPYSTIRKWIEQDSSRQQKEEHKPSYDIDEFMQYALKLGTESTDNTEDGKK